MLNTLPVDIVINIIQYLDIKDKNHVMETCTKLRDLILYKAICWSHLNFSSYPSISENTLLRFINRHLLQKHDADANRVTKIKCVIFLDLSGCKYLSSNFICWMLSLFTGLRELKLNQFGSPEIIDNRVTDSFNSMLLESYFGINPYNLQLPWLRVCDSTPDTAAKFILLQKELTKSKNQFYDSQENGIVSNLPLGRIGLSISFEELRGVLQGLTQLRTLCLHHKNINADGNISWIRQLKKLTNFDISYCHVEPLVLTSLLKTVLPQLTSLKLMEVQITESHLNFIKEQGTRLECLYLCCESNFESNNDIVATIGDTIGNLPKLNEFKLFSLGNETFDDIALNLNSRAIQKLDISSFKKTACKVSQLSISTLGSIPGGGLRPHQRRRLTGVPITKDGINHLACCIHLTELRLGCIMLQDDSLSTLYRSLCSLQVLELRYCYGDRDSNSTRSASKKLLVGIDKLTKLKELHLYSITVHKFAIDYINNIKSLEYLTLYDCGLYIESSAAIEFWLTQMSKLNILVLSQLSKPTSLWLTYINLIFSENKKDYHNVIFQRLCSTKTWHVI
ncbi:RNI-like protein [Backusella circina FSU 941]|nr:RNI-like protein [Backusella circina FSU 941]